MSSNSGVEYIKKIFCYNAKLEIYYKETIKDYILIAKLTYENVDIYKVYEMPETSEDIDGEIIIYSFDPDNPEHCQHLRDITNCRPKNPAI